MNAIAMHCIHSQFILRWCNNIENTMKQLCLFSTERGRRWESGARWIINHTLTCFQMNATFAFCQFKKNFGKNWTNPRERGWQIQPQSPSFQFIKLEPCASPPYIFVSSILSLHLEPLNEWDIISVLELLARGLCGLSWHIPLLGAVWPKMK